MGRRRRWTRAALAAAVYGTVALLTAGGASAAGTTAPWNVDMDLEGSVQVDGCTTGHTQGIWDTDNVQHVLTQEVFYVYGVDTCSTHAEQFAVWANGSSTVGVTFDTYGATINSKLVGYDHDDAMKKYDVWLNLRVKCVDTLQRFHPGVSCTGVATGTIAFGRYRIPVTSAGSELIWNELGRAATP